ncbi:HAD family hydrolase [Corynebacterium pseudopelargi]|nr:HAD family phosphatase [Corynebacterium pseudopelargi]
MIWDMDGTLVDSEPLWARGTFAMSEAMGKRLTPELQAQTVGASFSYTARLCAEHAGVELFDEAYWRRFAFENMRKMFSEELTLRPGVATMLQRFKASGVPMAIATNTEREVADAAIAFLGAELFQATVCGDEVPQGKPAPDIYHRAAELLGVAPSQCLVFEDSQAGMRAALAAKATVVGLPEREEDLVQGAASMRALVGGIDFDFDQAGDLAFWCDALQMGD